MGKIWLKFIEEEKSPFGIPLRKKRSHNKIAPGDIIQVSDDFYVVHSTIRTKFIWFINLVCFAMCSLTLEMKWIKMESNTRIQINFSNVVNPMLSCFIPYKPETIIEGFESHHSTPFNWNRPHEEFFDCVKLDSKTINSKIQRVRLLER